MVAVGLLWRWMGPPRPGRLPGEIVVEHQNGMREAGDGHACSYAPLPRPTRGSVQEIARAQQIHR